MLDLTQIKSELAQKYPLPPPDETFPEGSMPFQPFGHHIDMLYAKEPEVVISGPAGTGKTRACLEKAYILLNKYKNYRVLMVRKTRASLTQSAMVTWENEVLPPTANVIWRTGEQEYRFPGTGSVLVIGGMDKASKIMSSQYDLIYVPEATELSEEDWEMLNTRARNPSGDYNQLLGDCNPGPASHWIMQRKKDKKIRLIPTTHKDNPRYYDHDKKAWTKEGKAYLERLESLSGVRYLRLVKGIWATAEGAIYSEFDPDKHLIYRRELPAEWRRIRSIDFGYSNPFVCQWWAISPDDVMYRYREVYITQRTISHLARLIAELSKGEIIEATVADWDAGDRAMLEEAGINTVSAVKNIVGGIQRVQDRLKANKLYLLRDSTVEIDNALVVGRRPTSTEQEIDEYVWGNTKTKEMPAYSDDHGLDAMRYAVEYADMYRSSQTGGIFV